MTDPDLDRLLEDAGRRWGPAVVAYAAAQRVDPHEVAAAAARAALGHDDFCREHGLPTWVAKNDGWQFVDPQGRLVRARFSRFHGLMVYVGGQVAYVGDAAPTLAIYIQNRLARWEADKAAAAQVLREIRREGDGGP